jgi:hypothetical protein
MNTITEWAVSAWGHGQHAGGTHSIVEWMLVGLAACVVAYAFYKAVSHTVHPGETSADHIKRRILDEGEEAR